MIKKLKAKGTEVCKSIKYEYPYDLKSKSIVVGDIHLGQKKYNDKSSFYFEIFLKKNIMDPPDYFIINGDFLDLWRAEFNDIIEDNKNIFYLLKVLGENGTKIKYILGNHDYQIRKHRSFFENFPNFEIIEDCYFFRGNLIAPWPSTRSSTWEACFYLSFDNSSIS